MGRQCIPDVILKNQCSMMQTCQNINVNVGNTDMASIELLDRFELGYRTPSNFISRNDRSVVFISKIRRLRVIHHLCGFQALTDPFLMWKWMVSDNLNLSDNSIITYPIC